MGIVVDAESEENPNETPFCIFGAVVHQKDLGVRREILCQFSKEPALVKPLKFIYF